MSYPNDLSNILYAADTFRPQTLSATGNGISIDVAQAGGNLINAKLGVGAVNTLTSLIVKMQASVDGTNFDDITGAVFSTVTVANTEQIISFQLPTATTPTAAAYHYVRAVGTLVGTSVVFYVTILVMKQMPNPTLGYQAAPPTIN